MPKIYSSAQSSVVHDDKFSEGYKKNIPNSLEPENSRLISSNSSSDRKRITQQEQSIKKQLKEAKNTAPDYKNRFAFAGNEEQESVEKLETKAVKSTGFKTPTMRDIHNLKVSSNKSKPELNDAKVTLSQKQRNIDDAMKFARKDLKRLLAPEAVTHALVTGDYETTSLVRDIDNGKDSIEDKQSLKAGLEKIKAVIEDLSVEDAKSIRQAFHKAQAAGANGFSISIPFTKKTWVVNNSSPYADLRRGRRNDDDQYKKGINSLITEVKTGLDNIISPKNVQRKR